MSEQSQSVAPEQPPAQISSMPTGDVVGYSRPPKRTQFKPGCSGNPRGRPKGARNVTTQREELYTAPINVRDGNGDRKIPRFLAADLALINKALKGDVKAVQQVYKNAKELGIYDDKTDARSQLTRKEIALLSDEELAFLIKIQTRFEQMRNAARDKPSSG